MVEAERVAGAGSDMTQRCFHVGFRLMSDIRAYELLAA